MFINILPGGWGRGGGSLVSGAPMRAAQKKKKKNIVKNGLAF